MFCARIGTFVKSISRPTFPFEAISIDDDVKPAAPISCIAIIASSFMSSRQASNNNFSVKGSPT